MKFKLFFNYTEPKKMKPLNIKFAYTVLSAAIILSFTACNLLQVDNPSNLTDEDLDIPSQIDFLVNSAAGNVLNAYPRVILATGLISDDLMPGSSQTAYRRLDEGFFDISVDDQRPFDLNTTYNMISQARWVAHTSTTKIRDMADPDDARIAIAQTYEAFSLLLFAENWFRATLDGEAPISDMDLYQMVLTKLNDALSVAQAASDPFETYILGLLARTNYSLYVETEDAAYLATSVGYAQQALAKDSQFIFNGVYNSTHQANYVLTSMNTNTLPVTPEYPFIDRKDIYSGNSEPRAQTGPFKENNPDGNPVHDQLKYPSRDSPIPIVKWQEMNLILAENELEKGTPDIASALTYMNKNRAAAGLPDMATTDINEAFDFLIYERATEFWLEGRRWMDMRHFDVPFVRWVPESIANGIDRKFDVGYIEQSTNPNF